MLDPTARWAFTLAEVLITLGIIGVVAAMTMPSLITKYQMKAFEVAFKKQYSVLNNTINFLTMEGLSECYITLVPQESDNGSSGYRYSAISSDCSALKEGMIEKLKMDYIGTIDKVANYTSSADVLSNGGVAVNGTVAYNHLSRLASSYLLADGTIVSFLTSEATGNADMFNVAFIVDVNGKKGPNKWGYDVFWLTLVKKNDKIRLTDEYASLSEKGGRLPRTILLGKDENKKLDITDRTWD